MASVIGYSTPRTSRDDHVVTGQQRRGCSMAEPVDLVVDGGVLLDEGVGLRHVGLGLVVVVVGNEVLDPILGEELTELVGQLGGEGLVGGDDQGRALDLLDHPGDRRRLPRARDPEQRLKLLTCLEPLGQSLYRLRLITSGLKVRVKSKGRHRTSVPVVCIHAARGFRLDPRGVAVPQFPPSNPA
jgi:hypothetical protein